MLVRTLALLHLTVSFIRGASMSTRHINSGYVGVLFATFLALIWMIWSGLTVMLPDNTDEGCNCQPVFHVIGHRGLSVKAPENTLPAFELAAEVMTNSLA